MAVFKRWKGKRITADHPNWDEAHWTVLFRVQGKRVWQAIPTARTKAQALSAESKLKEDAFNRTFGRGAKQIGLTEFFDTVYLPQATSYRDDASRGKLIKAYFKDTPLRDITTTEVERFLKSILGKKTKRLNPRSQATTNRYFSLLSGVFTCALKQQPRVVDYNPCSILDKPKERSRERYLTADEQPRLIDAMVDDLAFLITPLEIALNTGLRKEELLNITPADINLGGFSIFREGLEVLPNWLFIPKTKNGRERRIPMNSVVRDALRETAIGAKPDEIIFSFKRNGVSWSTIRRGFERACKAASIPHGQKISNGLIWHDLRRTFATRLRALGVHEYDIKDLLGHTIPGVTSAYARLIPDVLENAVQQLAETRGKVVSFERKVG